MSWTKTMPHLFLALNSRSHSGQVHLRRYLRRLKRLMSPSVPQIRSLWLVNQNILPMVRRQASIPSEKTK